MKKLIPFIAIVLLSACSTVDKANVTAAASTLQTIADIALAASGNGQYTTAFNSLSGMALALYQGNNPVAGSGNATVANAVLSAFPSVSPATLNAAAATMPIK